MRFLFSGERRRALRPVAGVAVPALVGACAGEGNEAPRGSEPDAEWVRQTVQVFTLERMFVEQDTDVLIANAGDEARDLLVDSRVLVEDGEGWRVETDDREWSVYGREEADDSAPPLVRVRDGLYLFMQTNTVTWCAVERPGYDFAMDYPGMDGESFETLEEYEVYIAEYVDCGAGRGDGS